MGRLSFGPSFSGVDVMSRLTFGPSFADVVVSPGPALADVVPTAVSAADRAVVLSVPEFDPATGRPPIAVHACYLASAPDPSATPADVLGGTGDAFVGHAPVSAAGEVTIAAAGVPAGTYFVQTIVEYAE